MFLVSLVQFQFWLATQMFTIFNCLLCHPLLEWGAVAVEYIVLLANQAVLQWIKAFWRKVQITRAGWVRGGRKGFAAQTFLQLPSCCCAQRGGRRSAALPGIWWTLPRENKLGTLVLFQIDFSPPWVKHQGLYLCRKWHLVAKAKGGIWSFTLSDLDRQIYLRQH